VVRHVERRLLHRVLWILLVVASIHRPLHLREIRLLHVGLAWVVGVGLGVHLGAARHHLRTHAEIAIEGLLGRAREPC